MKKTPPPHPPIKSVALTLNAKIARRCVTLLAVFGFVSAVWTLSATAASFPCAKAATSVEKLICADRELSGLDDKLAAAYRQAMESTRGDKEPLHEGQRLWLAERNRCPDVACLKAAYEVRLAGLELYIFGPVIKPATPSTKPDAIPAAELGATGKYPPYPEVWGYGHELAFPVPQDRRVFGVWKMNNEDYFFIYTKSEQIARKDGSCCDLQFADESLQFFSGVRKDIMRREIDQLRNKYQSLSGDAYHKITFSDGSSIERVRAGGPAHCYFPYHIVKKDRDGKVIARKNLLYLRDQPKKQPLDPGCEDSGGVGYFGQSVGEVGYSFLPLSDDTFVVYGGEGNFIRFDKDFNTRYKLNDQVFLIDVHIVEELIKQSADEQWKETKLKGNVSNASIIDSLVGNHLRKQRRSEIDVPARGAAVTQIFIKEVKAARAKNRSATQVPIHDLVAKYIPKGTRREAALQFCRANGLKIYPIRDKRNFLIDPKTYDEAVVCTLDMKKEWYLFWTWWVWYDEVRVSVGIKDGVVVWAGGAIYLISL